MNSFHDFCIVDCPIEFDVLARAEDRSIECVTHKEHQILGIMWHPERDQPFKAQDLNLFKRFIRGVEL